MNLRIFDKIKKCKGTFAFKSKFHGWMEGWYQNQKEGNIRNKARGVQKFVGVINLGYKWNSPIK